MRLNDKKFWLVSDPNPRFDPDWADIFADNQGRGYSLTSIGHMFRGSGADWLKTENVAVYDNPREAEADALKRLAKLGGWERDPKALTGVKPKTAGYSYDRTMP